MVHAELWQPDLACILEPAGIGRRRDTIFGVAVDLAGPRAGRGARDRHDRALVVGVWGRGRRLLRIKCI